MRTACYPLNSPGDSLKDLPEYKDLLAAEIQNAHVICLIYAVDNRSSMDRISSFWIPHIRSIRMNGAGNGGGGVGGSSVPSHWFAIPPPDGIQRSPLSWWAIRLIRARPIRMITPWMKQSFL